MAFKHSLKHQLTLAGVGYNWDARYLVVTTVTVLITIHGEPLGEPLLTTIIVITPVVLLMNHYDSLPLISITKPKY